MLTQQPLFTLTFGDQSTFALPEQWSDVFAEYFGDNPENYARVEVRLRFIVGKYAEHRAFPSKFDGIGLDDESDRKYDNPDFYFESWDESRALKAAGIEKPMREPTLAEIAEAAMYQTLRLGLMQKALNQMAKAKGQPAPRVLTPEQFLSEMNRKAPSVNPKPRQRGTKKANSKLRRRS